jgi:hypothetical protein
LAQWEVKLMDTENDEQLARNLQLVQETPELEAQLQVRRSVRRELSAHTDSAAATFIPQSLIITARSAASAATYRCRTAPARCASRSSPELPPLSVLR